MLAAYRHSNCYGRNPNCYPASQHLAIAHFDDRLSPNTNQHAAGKSTHQYRAGADRHAATTYRDARASDRYRKYSSNRYRSCAGRNHSARFISASDRNFTYESKKATLDEN